MQILNDHIKNSTKFRFRSNICSKLIKIQVGKQRTRKVDYRKLICWLEFKRSTKPGCAFFSASITAWIWRIKLDLEMAAFKTYHLSKNKIAYIYQNQALVFRIVRPTMLINWTFTGSKFHQSHNYCLTKNLKVGCFLEHLTKGNN